MFILVKLAGTEERIIFSATVFNMILQLHNRFGSFEIDGHGCISYSV